MDNPCISPADILLPNIDDYTSWACIACDQFTSEKKYWEELGEFVRGKKTTLDLILPEIYLDGNEDERIEKINGNIESYLNGGVFSEYKNSFILTVRSTPFNKCRVGIVGKLDLETYDYKKGVRHFIRATEDTIEERIPPRLKIRKDAGVEFPHIMVLYDDEKLSIAEKLYEKRDTLKKLYDFDLNMGGGHITGYLVDDNAMVINAFNGLLDGERLLKKYGTNDKFLFAVGDGNHSLATAKTHWENLKKTLSLDEIKSHPARYALCEFVNVYDEGIKFEPIFRFVSGINRTDFSNELKTVFNDIKTVKDGVYKKSAGNNLAKSISDIDCFIKEYLNKKGGKVDYIHGEKNIINLVESDINSVGILLDKFCKNDLFKIVSNYGTLPRKTFSMGEGIEKRYYLEGRRIK